MKTREELSTLKEEVEALNKKLAELSEEELKQVTGGTIEFVIDDQSSEKEFHIYENLPGDPAGKDFEKKF